MMLCFNQTLFGFFLIAGCGDNEFKCHDGACIPASYACDSWADCSQGEDDCGCGGTYFLK
jgi:hypothetical protein